MKEIVLSVRNLEKIYTSERRNVPALRGINFEVERGQIFGILGINGAGKSTTLSILAGLLEPTSGEVTILGKDFFKNEEYAKQRMNIATPYADLAGNLTVHENLKMYALMYGVKNAREKIEKHMKEFNIESLKKAKFGELSAGQKTRVNLCKSLLNDPEILLLDEPTASLDPSMALRTRDLLLKLQKEQNRTIIFTSHNMSEVETLCDTVALLHKGEIYRIDTPENLIAEHNAPDLEEVFIRLADGEYEDD